MSEVVPPCLFPARTIRVHAPNVIEARIQLRFGVEVTRLLKLDNVSTDGLDDEARTRAAHCLVVLTGGKRLLVQLDDPATYRNPIEARVYLEERTHGRLVGQTFGISRSVNPVLEVSPFMRWVGERGYDVMDVKRALNGIGGHRVRHT